MFPETAKSSSVPSNQHPSWIINHGKGSHWSTTKFSQNWSVFFFPSSRSRVATFIRLSFVAPLCTKCERANQGGVLSFVSIVSVSSRCWIYQPVSHSFQMKALINTINSAFNPRLYKRLQLHELGLKWKYYFCPIKSHCAHRTVGTHTQWVLRSHRALLFWIPHSSKQEVEYFKLISLMFRNAF